MSVAACIMMVPALMVPDNRASPYVEDAPGWSDCDTFVTTIPLPGFPEESEQHRSLETMAPVIPTGK